MTKTNFKSCLPRGYFLGILGNLEGQLYLKNTVDEIFYFVL